MEADNTLDPKKLTEELEKMTEVNLNRYSGLKQLSSLKNQLSQLKVANLNSNSSLLILNLMKAEIKLLVEVLLYR